MRVASDVAVSNFAPSVQADANPQPTNAKPALYQPSDQGLFTTKALDDSITNIKEGYNRIVHPDSWGGFVHGTIQLTGAIPQAIGADLGANLQQGAQWVNSEVDGIPVLQNVVKPLGDAVNGFGAALGDVFDGAGQSVNDIGGAFEDLSHGDGGKALCKLGDSFKDAGAGVVNAATDVVKSVGDTIGDFFSGW
jgi:hypothetical protein